MYLPLIATALSYRSRQTQDALALGLIVSLESLLPRGWYSRRGAHARAVGPSGIASGRRAGVRARAFSGVAGACF